MNILPPLALAIVGNPLILELQLTAGAVVDALQLPRAWLARALWPALGSGSRPFTAISPFVHNSMIVAHASTTGPFAKSRENPPFSIASGEMVARI